MRSSFRARHTGRTLRHRLDPELTLSEAELFSALCSYLQETWKIEVHPSASRRMRGRNASIQPGLLFYDRALDADPIKRLLIVAHEVGHAVHHRRVHGLTDLPDPAQIMTRTGRERGPAEARYSPVTRDEVQAGAFALEFTCPAEAALKLWISDPDATSSTIARRLHTMVKVARAQLGEAIGEKPAGPFHTSESNRQVDRNDAIASKRKISSPPDVHQTPAITHTGSAALIDAGPGCGKTFTLVERVAWRIDEDIREAQECGEELSALDAANHFLVLTFSTEAAEELEGRLEQRLGEEIAVEIEVATFHGLGRQILAIYGGALGIDRNAPILDEVAQVELLHAALAVPGAERIVNLKDPEETARIVARHIQYLKLRLTEDPSTTLRCPWTPDLFEARLATLEADLMERSDIDEDEAQDRADRLSDARAFAAVFRAYESEKLARGAIDFADLIATTITVLRSNPESTKYYRSRYGHVLVDEFQDMSRSVSLFLELLCGDNGEPWAVGDPNQSIYRFLNADPGNLADFLEAFRAKPFDLNHNYRSAPEIVGVANELSALLRHKNEADALSSPSRFVAAGTERAAPALPGDRSPVVVAVAQSDNAERAGVVNAVCNWIESGIPPHEIAVLARRNIDVREIVLALGACEVRATAGAIMTPEGTAGDLAAVITFAEGKAGFRASLPRIAYAIGQGRYTRDVIDSVIKHLLDQASPDNKVDLDSLFDNVMLPGVEGSLICKISKAYQILRRERYASDAFAMLAAFLFDGSDYIRRLLAQNEDGGEEAGFALAEAASVLRLAEVASTLARSAAYGYAHPIPKDEELHLARRRARLNFASTFRRELTTGIPTPIAPPRSVGAVQVMTCHASKGLEFPYVCVVGQTLSPLSSSFEWLPNDLQPSESQDAEQADALFFVAATRAQRSLVISYAERATANKGRPRKITPLLGRWMQTYNPRRVNWGEPESANEVSLIQPFGAIWGRHGAPHLSTYHVSPRTCSLSTYVEKLAALRFPEAQPPLYPRYVNTLHFVLQQVIRISHTEGSPVARNVAQKIFDRKWKEVSQLFADHPHLDLYERIGRRTALAFASAYSKPLATEHCPIKNEGHSAPLHPEIFVRSGLLAAFFSDEGCPVAILFRTESYTKKAKARGYLNWSDLSTSRQLPLALFHERWVGEYPSVSAYIFSAIDGVLYPFAWSRKPGSMTTLRKNAEEKVRSLYEGPFKPQVSSWSCDRCRSRIKCPHFIQESLRDTLNPRM